MMVSLIERAIACGLHFACVCTRTESINFHIKTYSAPRDLHRRAAYSICESWFLIHQDVYHDLFVCS